MVSWLVWSILRVQFQKLCRQYCGNVCVGASGVSGDQLDPVSLLPPTVMLLEFLNYYIDTQYFIPVACSSIDVQIEKPYML